VKAEKGKDMPRVLTVTSGKGGVGKTNISVNLALDLSRQGHRTCLFDADLGLANVNILLGIYPDHSLEDLISRRKGIEEILITNENGFDIIPGSSGIERMADLESEQVDYLIDAFSKLETYDFLIFDTSAGVSRNVVSFCLSSSEIILIVTPEPTSLTDGYALLKILALNGFKGTAMVLVNQCKDMKDARDVFLKFKQAVHKFLPVSIMPVGSVVKDPHVVEAVKRQKPFVSLFPEADASRCIKNASRYILKNRPTDMKEPGLQGFWAQCFRHFAGPMQLGGAPAEPKSRRAANPASGSPDAHEGEIERAAPVRNEKDKKEEITRDLGALLKGLVASMSSIAEDITAIRKAIEVEREEKRSAASRV
jgi:flagellar biosynthesis protein FlhG